MCGAVRLMYGPHGVVTGTLKGLCSQNDSLRMSQQKVAAQGASRLERDKLFNHKIRLT